MNNKSPHHTTSSDQITLHSSLNGSNLSPSRNSSQNSTHSRLFLYRKYCGGTAVENWRGGKWWNWLQLRRVILVSLVIRAVQLDVSDLHVLTVHWASKCRNCLLFIPIIPKSVNSNSISISIMGSTYYYTIFFLFQPSLFPSSILFFSPPLFPSY